MLRISGAHGGRPLDCGFSSMTCGSVGPTVQTPSNRSSRPGSGLRILTMAMMLLASGVAPAQGFLDLFMSPEQMRDPRAVDVLSKALFNEELDVRLNAAPALARFGARAEGSRCTRRRRSSNVIARGGNRPCGGGEKLTEKAEVTRHGGLVGAPASVVGLWPLGSTSWYREGDSNPHGLSPNGF